MQNIKLGNCVCMTKLAKFLISSSIEDSLLENERRITNIINIPDLNEATKKERLTDLRTHTNSIRELRSQIQSLPDC